LKSCAGGIQLEPVGDKAGRESFQPCSDRRLPEAPNNATKFYFLILADRLNIIKKL
jgi:hypothetical protein